MKEEKRELIWVSKKLAEEYKQLDSVEEQERAVKRIIKDKRLDLEEEQELLSESLLMFKSVCLSHRKELTNVYEEQLDLLNRLWEDMGDIKTQINQHVEKMVNKISPLRKEVSDLKKEIENLRLYVPEQLARLAEHVGGMDENTRSLLRELLAISANNKTQE
jgi:Na+/phosphate symporter